MRPALSHLVAYLNFQLFSVDYNFTPTFWAVNRTILHNRLLKHFWPGFSAAIRAINPHRFWFSFFGCERSESTAGVEASDDNWSRGLPLSKGSKSLIGKEILHRPIPIRKRVLLSMKAIFLCHISAYLVLWAIKYPPGGGGPRKRQAIGSFPSSVMSVSLSFFHPCWVAKWAYSRSNSSIIWVGTNIGIQTPLDSIFSFDLHQSGKRRRTHLFHSERPNQATKKKKNWRKFSFHSN